MTDTKQTDAGQYRFRAGDRNFPDRLDRPIGSIEFVEEGEVVTWNTQPFFTLEGMHRLVHRITKESVPFENARPMSDEEWETILAAAKTAGLPENYDEEEAEEGGAAKDAPLVAFSWKQRIGNFVLLALLAAVVVGLAGIYFAIKDAAMSTQEVKKVAEQSKSNGWFAGQEAFDLRADALQFQAAQLNIYARSTGKKGLVVKIIEDLSSDLKYQIDDAAREVLDGKFGYWNSVHKQLQIASRMKTRLVDLSGLFASQVDDVCDEIVDTLRKDENWIYEQELEMFESFNRNSEWVIKDADRLLDTLLDFGLLHDRRVELEQACADRLHSQEKRGVKQCVP